MSLEETTETSGLDRARPGCAHMGDSLIRHSRVSGNL
jgi:hypothetical protein